LFRILSWACEIAFLLQDESRIADRVRKIQASLSIEGVGGNCRFIELLRLRVMFQCPIEVSLPDQNPADSLVTERESAPISINGRLACIQISVDGERFAVRFQSSRDITVRNQISAQCVIAIGQISARDLVTLVTLLDRH
jgi:hypothetical protein